MKESRIFRRCDQAAHLSPRRVYIGGGAATGAQNRSPVGRKSACGRKFVGSGLDADPTTLIRLGRSRPCGG